MWAEYAMRRAGGGTEKPVSVRYVVAEKTPAKIALEVNTKSERGTLMMRSDFFPAGADAWKLGAMHMEVGEKKMDLPPEQVALSRPVKTNEPPGDLLGTETVTTPAGTFPCKHYRKAISPDPKAPAVEMWISDKVLPTGVVKSTLVGTGIETVLVTTGTATPAAAAPKGN
jgi:hypothetical protein